MSAPATEEQTPRRASRFRRGRRPLLVLSAGVLGLALAGGITGTALGAIGGGHPDPPPPAGAHRHPGPADPPAPPAPDQAPGQAPDRD